jgi:hypothetical protein
MADAENTKDTRTTPARKAAAGSKAEEKDDKATSAAKDTGASKDSAAMAKDSKAGDGAERAERAQESVKLEKRPGIRSDHGADAFAENYSVENELRVQWPGINLGDDEE